MSNKSFNKAKKAKNDNWKTYIIYKNWRGIKRRQLSNEKWNCALLL